MLEKPKFGREIDPVRFMEIDHSFWSLPGDFRYTIDPEMAETIMGYTDDMMAYFDFNGVPAVAFKGIRRDTGGDIGRIHKTSDDLTARGSWSVYDPGSDTFYLVTFSVAQELQKVRLDGRKIYDIALERLLEYYNTTYPGVMKISYSPGTARAGRIHIKHNALPINFLPDARPGLMIAGEPANNTINYAYIWPDLERCHIEYIGRGYPFFDIASKRQPEGHPMVTSFGAGKG